MFARDDDPLPGLSRRSPVTPADSAVDPNQRPAGNPLTPAGRASSGGTAADGLKGLDRDSLVKEIDRLRRRTRQQDEAMTRLAQAVSALRRGGQALRAENRELRLAVQYGERDRARATS